MTALALHSHSHNLLRPEPRAPTSIRVAAENDLRFIDDLQKKHSKMVGWMSKTWLEANIKQGNMLIATDPATHERVGYCLYKDHYFKREDCGIVYQLNVLPGKQRGLIGAALIQAAFERSAYGVKLFCCWCAQDIEANHFWESIGFVPLAFRAGSRGAAQGGRRKEGRVHIFWQKRIRAGDSETPYWYPTETTGGALKENRIVLPIPPGTHWSDAKPMVVPGGVVSGGLGHGAAPALLSAESPKPKRKPKPKQVAARPAHAARGGLWFAPALSVPPADGHSEPEDTKPKREKRPKQKNDPKLVAMAREFRDRYLDEVNSGRFLPEAWGTGKYDVSRQLPGQVGANLETPLPLLEQGRIAA